MRIIGGTQAMQTWLSQELRELGQGGLRAVPAEAHGPPRDGDTGTALALLGSPGGDIWGAIRAADAAGYRVLAVTEAANGIEAAFAIAAGAVGYVARPRQTAELRAAVAQTHAGAVYTTPQLASALLVGLRSADLRSLLGSEQVAQTGALLRLLARGWPPATAGRALNLDDTASQRLLFAARNAFAATAPDPPNAASGGQEAP